MKKFEKMENYKVKNTTLEFSICGIWCQFHFEGNVWIDRCEIADQIDAIYKDWA